MNNPPSNPNHAAIEQLLDWSAPQEVQTKYGPRLLRKAEPNEGFWRLWKEQKPALKQAGVSASLSRYTGKWEVTWWLPLPEEVQAARQQAFAESKAASADIELPHPEGLDYLPFQKAGIRYALSRPNVLIADEMGLGKTIQAIGIINADPSADCALVIAPKSVMLNWRNELVKWLVRPMTVGLARGEWPHDADVVVINYEGLEKHREHLMAREWAVAIWDEAHFIKNADTKRSILSKGRPARKARGRKPAEEAVPAIPARRKVRLTGTPIVNRPQELFNLISDLDPQTWGDWWQFAKRYCGASRTRFGWDLGGATNLEELQRRLRETVMVRRLKSEVLTELPRKIRQVIEVEPNGLSSYVAREQAFEQQNAELLAELRRLLESSKEEGEQAYREAVSRLRAAQQVAFEEMARLRHETALAKVPVVLDHLRSFMDEDEGYKVIVAAHHHDVIDALAAGAAEAGWGPVKLTGETNLEDRQRVVEAFQTDPAVRVFVASIQAAGVGITLTAAAHVVFAELDWVPASLSQMEDRAHRISQVNTVLVQHLVLAGSLDARMVRVLVRKQEVIEQALDREVTPPPAPPAPKVEAPRLDLTRPAPAVSEALRTAVHKALRILAGDDQDFARERNNVGFSKYDVHIGHSLSQAQRLTDKQVLLGRRIVKKYHRQLPDELLAVINGEEA